MPKFLEKYYAIHVGRKTRIYMSWKECCEQIHKYPGTLYKKFYTKKQAEEYINEQNQEKMKTLNKFGQIDVVKIMEK